MVTLTDKVIILQLPDDTQRSFPLSPDLAAGKLPSGAGFGERYTIGDLQLGDIITVKYDTLPTADLCQKVRIERRPGGMIPPEHDEKDGLPLRWHELANALQQQEENGTPLPEKFRPKPTPPWGQPKSQLPVAPMPREVKR